MITKLTEQKGCIIAEFIDLKRFTLAVTEEVKSELKPILSQEGNKMIFDFKNIEFYRQQWYRLYYLISKNSQKQSF